MLGLARAMQAAAAISVALLLQAVSAKVLDEESCMSEEPAAATGALLIQKSQEDRADLMKVQTQSDLKKAGEGLEANRSAASTSWCIGSAESDCWRGRPPPGTPACTADSGTAACLCADTDCRIDNLHSATPTTGRCYEKSIYELDGEVHKSVGTGAVDVVATSQEVYCKRMVKNDRWKAKHLVELPGDAPAVIPGKRKWQCWSPNKWWNGECQGRKTRYLGETCWSSRWGAGRCAGDEAEGEYSTSCYKGRCLPTAWAMQRHECTCASLGYHLIFACTAADGGCGGHACVVGARGGGKFYCDYDSAANW